jgi:hypothetical protein
MNVDRGRSRLSDVFSVGLEAAYRPTGGVRRGENRSVAPTIARDPARHGRRSPHDPRRRHGGITVGMSGLACIATRSLHGAERNAGLSPASKTRITLALHPGYACYEISAYRALVFARVRSGKHRDR